MRRLIPFVLTVGGIMLGLVEGFCGAFRDQFPRRQSDGKSRGGWYPR